MSENNMVKCKACGNDIAKGVKKCVNCGKDQRNFFMKHKIITGVLVLVLLSAVSGIIGGDEPKTASNNDSDINKVTAADSKKPEKEAEVKSEFKIDEVIETKEFSLVVNNPREVNSLTGSDKYLVYDVTITSKKDNFNFFGDIQGVTDDNEVIDDTIAFVKEELGDPIVTSWTKTLNNGQKAKGYIAFDREIDKIEVRSNFFKNDVITIKVD